MLPANDGDRYENHCVNKVFVINVISNAAADEDDVDDVDKMVLHVQVRTLTSGRSEKWYEYDNNVK